MKWVISIPRNYIQFKKVSAKNLVFIPKNTWFQKLKWSLTLFLILYKLNFKKGKGTQLIEILTKIKQEIVRGNQPGVLLT